MVSHIPVIVLKTSIISVVLDDLFPSDLKARLILIFCLCQIDQLVNVLAAEGSLAVVSRHRWSHL